MKLILIPLAATTTAALLALTADSPVSEVSNLTATAVLGWYAWHTATRTIPKLVESFRRELSAERAEHRADREAFLNEMSEERTQRHADNLVLAEALSALKSEL
jgi:hypothetical protein